MPRARGKVPYSRLFETSVATGTGNLVCDGPVQNALAILSRYTSGATEVPVVIVNPDSATDEWEIGLHTVQDDGNGNTLIVRTAANVESGTAGYQTLVNFTAGAKNVYVALTGEQIGDLFADVSFASITNLPSTLGGYGITDAVSDVDFAAHVGQGAGEHPVVTDTAHGFMAKEDKVRLQNVTPDAHWGWGLLKRREASADHTVTSGDAAHIVEAVGTDPITVTLGAASTLGAGFVCVIKNSTSVNLSLALATGDQLDGDGTTRSVLPNDALLITVTDTTAGNGRFVVVSYYQSSSDIAPGTDIIAGDLTTQGFLHYSTVLWQDCSAGTTQTNALIVSTGVIQISTSAPSGSGVRLPAASAGRFVFIINGSPNDINVWPHPGGNIDFVGADNPITVGQYYRKMFFCLNGTHWSSY